MYNDYLAYSMEIDEVLKDYYLFLKNESIYSDKSFDYIFNILDILKIERKYLDEISFDESLAFANGIYFPFKKKIVLNIKDLLISRKQNLISNDILVIEYFELLFHEINHTLQFKYKNEVQDDITYILCQSDYIRYIIGSNYRKFSKYYPDEIDSYLKSVNITNEFSKNNKDANTELLTKKRLIYYLTFNIFHEKEVINSQFDYLNKIILNNELFSDFHLDNEVNNIYLGLKKKNDTMKKILETYYTGELKININKGGFEK